MLYSHSNRDYMNKKRRKAVRVKHYPTKTLKDFIDRDFVGIDGLDREQYADEIRQEYWERTTRAMELDSKSFDVDWNEWLSVQEELPPAFPFTWDEENNDYIPF